MTSWKFLEDAKETLLEEAERERLFLEQNPRQPAKRKLTYEESGDGSDNDGNRSEEDSQIPPSGWPAPGGAQSFVTPAPGVPPCDECDISIIMISDDGEDL